jgi:hypothetical protein
VTSQNVTIKDTRHADQLNGTTTSTNAQYAIPIDTGCVNIKVDGFAAFGNLANVHPYTGIVQVATGSTGIDVRNIGTPAAPYNCGSANAVGTVIVASVMVNLQLRRIYAINTRTGVLNIANTVQGVVIDNVWGDDNDAQALAGINLTARGCRWTNSVTGQSSVYGRHWEDAWTSTTAGRILIACNEPLAGTADQAQITAGTPAFTSGGQIAMERVGDEVVWTMPYFALGATALANVAPVITGTNVTYSSANIWGNFFLDFQYDTGSGFNGTWLALNAATLSGIGAINPATGIKLKVRAQTRTAATTNALTYIRINTTTTATDRQIQYPLPRTELTITGFVSGSDVVIYDADLPALGDGSNVLATGDAVSGSFVFDYEGTPTIKVGVFKGGYVPQVSPPIALTTSNSNYLVQQRIDRNYSF